jgi:hypothetical protein
MAIMVNQPTQQALLKVLTNRTVLVKIPTVAEGYAREERVEKYKQNLYSIADVIKPAEIAQREITDRTNLIENKTLVNKEKTLDIYDDHPSKT